MNKILIKLDILFFFYKIFLSMKQSIIQAKTLFKIKLGDNEQCSNTQVQRKNTVRTSKR